jgi:hypothetical protein
MKKFLRVAAALLCLCFLQCHSLVEALKEISNQTNQTGGQQEEPQPSQDDTDTDTDTDNNAGRQRKSAD